MLVSCCWLVLLSNLGIHPPTAGHLPTHPSMPAQEARVARVLQRAAAPKFQKSGKPAMTRSVVQRVGADAGARQRDEDAEAELAAFLALIDESFHCLG